MGGAFIFGSGMGVDAGGLDSRVFGSGGGGILGCTVYPQERLTGATISVLLHGIWEESRHTPRNNIQN